MQSELRVFSREERNDRVEQLAHLEQLQESNPNPMPSEIHSSENVAENIDNNTSGNDLQWPIALRKGVRSCTTKHPIYNFISYKGLSTAFRAFVTCLDKVQMPNNIQEALIVHKWRKTMLEEIRALEKNGTWEVSKLPSGKRTIGCKWIFTIKYKANGSIDRFKARLVAKGYTRVLWN